MTTIVPRWAWRSFGSRFGSACIDGRPAPQRLVAMGGESPSDLAVALL